MDAQWLREWATGEAEYPPRDLREQVGQLLDELEGTAMPSKPAEHLRAATWRLDGQLLDEVRAACQRHGEPVVTFVVRALRRELDDSTDHAEASPT
jgi:hypothetical protein